MARFPKAEYEAALASELDDRAFPFLGLPETICGIECEPLTPRRVEWLRMARSPFIIGGQVGPVEIAHFVWIVSKAFTPSIEKRDEFLRANLTLDVAKARKDIDEYIGRAYLNAPDGKPICPKVSQCATYAHAMAGEPYRMQWREVIETPLAILHQLMAAHDMSEGRTVINKRSDRFFGDFADALQAEQQKAAARQKRKERARK